MTNSTADTTRRLMNALNVFRNLHYDFPSQYIYTFLTVAMNEGMSNRDIAARTGLSRGAVHRNIKALSPEREEGKPGYNLMDARVNPDDDRLRVVFLTEHGKDLYRQVLAEFGHGKEDSLPASAESYGFTSNRKDIPPTYLAPTTKVFERKKG